jgi:hypothetical protein
MPIFIAISGFLVNKAKLAELSFWDVVKKYVPRLLIPWSIAVAVYVTIIEWYRLGEVGLRDFVYLYYRVFIKPYYHLWFILGFLCYIFVTWMMLKLRFNNWMLIAVATVISIISKYKLYYTPSETIAEIVEKLHYDFRIYNLIFFIVGMLLKEILSQKQASNKSLQLAYLIVIAAAAYNVYLFYYDFSFSKRLIYYILNLPLSYILLTYAKDSRFPRSRLIEYIGKNSMAFYLWHVIPLIAAKNVAGYENDTAYYILSILFLGITAILIYYLSKIAFINRYLFGALQK